MIDLRFNFQITGWIACCIALMMLIPAGADIAYDNDDWLAFIEAAGISCFIGVALILMTLNTYTPSLDCRQAFLLIIFGWITMTILGAIPFLGLNMSLTDAVFETMSGITTTGSTVLTNLDHLPPGILLWRALLQWIGGIGVIAIAVLILPFLRIGGMQLFRIESSGVESDHASFTLKTVTGLSGIYVLLTSVCAILFYAFGMSPFDAIIHAMTTVSTGGYSSHDASFGYFSDYRLQWTAIVFMACGAIPFLLFLKAAFGDYQSLITDQQVRGFILLLASTSVALALWLMTRQDISFFDALTETAFNITSVVTTTGFASTDYTTWGNGAIGAFVALMFVGGCAGSTAGAIKIYRFQVLLMFVRAHLKKLFSPNRVIILKYNGKALENDLPLSVLAFLAVFIATIAFFTTLLTFLDIDILTAYTASVTAVTNVGPGIGEIIGPSGNFQTLPDLAKWILTIAMLAGRLEVLALLVFFERDFWTT